MNVYIKVINALLKRITLGTQDIKDSDEYLLKFLNNKKINK